MNPVEKILDQSSYSKQLRSDEWKAFSAHIRRDQKCCQMCRRSDVMIQVHHIFYDFEKKLWEYEREDVMVLCEVCHTTMHEELKKFRKHVFKHLNAQSFKILNSALETGLTKYVPLVFCHALAEFSGNARLVENHARAWGVSSDKNSERSYEYNATER